MKLHVRDQGLTLLQAGMASILILLAACRPGMRQNLWTVEHQAFARAQAGVQGKTARGCSEGTARTQTMGLNRRIYVFVFWCLTLFFSQLACISRQLYYDFSNLRMRAQFGPC